MNCTAFGRAVDAITYAGLAPSEGQIDPLVYEELHRLAHRHMRLERPNHTLQTSALVNEAYVRLVDQRNLHWKNRAHFFSIASRLMRRILVDLARAHHRAKRGGGALQVSLDEAAIVSRERAAELVALDEALTRLAAIDQRKSQVVELRFFGGMSVEEAAEALGVSPITIKRDWSTAKAWLYRAIANGVAIGE
ncbi:MAG TPA: sigma-70 family RNA polymerase sigma factor [Pyrinomonadaceae bacterium]|nr:sigma-70 family RNA polymerase sigma factor [Pyrinomonadaceae bacterium]